MLWRLTLLLAMSIGLAGCEGLPDRNLATTQLRPVTAWALEEGQSRDQVARRLAGQGFTPAASDRRLTPQQAQAVAGADIFTRHSAFFPCAFDTDLFVFFDATGRLARVEGIRHEAGCT